MKITRYLLGWIHATIRAFLVVLALGIVFVGIFIGYINHKPLSLLNAFPYIQPYVEDYGFTVEAQAFDLGFKRRFFLSTNGFKLKDAEGHVRLKVKEGRVSFANRQLIRGNIALKHAHFKGVVGHLQVRHDGLYVGDELLMQTTAPTPAPAATLGLVGMLNQLESHPLFKEFRTLKITQSHVLLKDKRTHVDWLMQDVQTLLTRYPNNAKQLTMQGKIRQKQVRSPMPFVLKAEHTQGMPWLEASVKFENSDTDFVKSYIPPALQKVLKSRGEIELGTRIKSDNSLDDPYFLLHLEETSFFPEEAYSHPLNFKSIYLRGRYQGGPQDVLELEEVTLTDTDGDTLAVTGRVYGLETDPRLDINIKSNISTLDKVIHYLPDEAMHATTNWLKKATHNVKVGQIEARYTGQPSNMPFCRKQCGLEVTADVLDGELKFFEHAGPATNISATLTLKEDWLNVEARQALWAGQKARAVSVTLVGLFTPGDSTLHVEGAASGALDQLLTGLSNGLEDDSIPEAYGTVDGDFHIVLPIHKEKNKDPHINDIDLDIAAQLHHVSMPLEDFGGGTDARTNP